MWLGWVVVWDGFLFGMGCCLGWVVWLFGNSMCVYAVLYCMCMVHDVSPTCYSWYTPPHIIIIIIVCPTLSPMLPLYFILPFISCPPSFYAALSLHTPLVPHVPLVPHTPFVKNHKPFILPFHFLGSGESPAASAMPSTSMVWYTSKSSSPLG